MKPRRLHSETIFSIVTTSCHGGRMLVSARPLTGTDDFRRMIQSMPTYEYRCDERSHTFEAMQSFNDEPLTECEVCGRPVAARHALPRRSISRATASTTPTTRAAAPAKSDEPRLDNEHRRLTIELRGPTKAGATGEKSLGDDARAAQGPPTIERHRRRTHPRPRNALTSACFAAGVIVRPSWP